MLHKISLSDFDQLFQLNETMLVHLHDESCNGSLKMKKHLQRLDRVIGADITIIQLELASNTFIAEYLAKDLCPGLYLIKNQRCRRDFNLKPISFRLFKLLIEECIREKEKIQYVS